MSLKNTMNIKRMNSHISEVCESYQCFAPPSQIGHIWLRGETLDSVQGL